MSAATDPISTDDLSRLSGASLRQIRYWETRGWISMDHGNRGSGGRMFWSPALVPVLRAALARIDWGMAVGPKLFVADLPTVPHPEWFTPAPAEVA